MTPTKVTKATTTGFCTAPLPNVFLKLSKKEDKYTHNNFIVYYLILRRSLA